MTAGAAANVHRIADVLVTIVTKIKHRVLVADTEDKAILGIGLINWYVFRLARLTENMKQRAGAESS